MRPLAKEIHEPRFIERDPYLKPYETVIRHRLDSIARKEAEITNRRLSLLDFASGHTYFGLHHQDGDWVFREWAPHASRMFLIGTMTNWQATDAFALQQADASGVWEIRLADAALRHGDLYRLFVQWPGGEGHRIPAYARRIVQDPDTLIFNAQVWNPEAPYDWKCKDFQRPSAPPLIYEVHIGMSQEEPKIGSYKEFRDHTLHRIVKAGYNTLQLMAIPEHPYYGSFGYQVSSFFAASSRYGSPDELKALVDAAHEEGLTVIMDLIHSHAVNNEVEGLSRFDGTTYQYFHQGARGFHPTWDSRCFNYNKPEVLHFLLSNCRYWLDEFRFDGYRFDGVTSMLYHHHGLGKAFTSYDDYFDDSVDEEALVYLALANRLIHKLRPDALTIAEDVSGMPGLAVASEEGGIGFDYRFAMGVPDNWIRFTKDTADENWPMEHLWHELTNRRQDEKTISYAESHDQALVGDQTIIFRLIGADIYDHMDVADQNIKVDRGLALHKMIRLITLATAANGYLNFMGNEFGHPEWIDFPREGNQWSYHYARRQWSLVDDTGLKYHFLAHFDRDMLALENQYRFLAKGQPRLLHLHQADKVIAFERNNLVFVFNFHPMQSFTDYSFEVVGGQYRMVLNSDDALFGGHGRLESDQVHLTHERPLDNSNRHVISLYLPSRSAMVLHRI